MADEFGMRAEKIRRGKNMIWGNVQAVVSYFAIRELRYSGAELGKMLHLNRSGVGVVAKRGEEIARNNSQYRNFIT